VSENKVLAHPASADSVPTSANQEDHVSMGPIAARHARTVLAHVEQILAIELLVATQALDAGSAPTGPARGGRRGGPRTGPRPCRDAGPDREPGPDLAAALDLVRTGALAGLATP
jgi:histidine ammonia-lyase